MSLGFAFQTVVKGKAVPLQAWSGPEGSRKLRFPDFVTTAQDGGTRRNLGTKYSQKLKLRDVNCGIKIGLNVFKCTDRLECLMDRASL